ncbi:unnamed protein product [Arabidopsis halleri]
MSFCFLATEFSFFLSIVVLNISLNSLQERSILAPSNEDHRSAAQITDGSTSNVDITAPGAIIALTLMYLKVGLKDGLTR